MNYIYDIVLNFQNKYYQIYEWQTTDEIINITKIPIIKIKDKDYQNIKYHQTKITDQYLLDLPHTTYNHKNNNQNIIILTTSQESLGILINSRGHVIKKSSLLFEEEEEVLETSLNQKEQSINYEIIKKETNNNICRLEYETKQILIKKINNLLKQQKLEILKYIYYDIKEQEKNNIDEIHQELINIINHQYKEYYSKINQLVNNL